VKLFLRVKLFHIREQVFVIFHFYRCLGFAFTDLLLGFCSLFFNPYRLANGSYGETSLRMLQQLTLAAGLCSKDHYMELGSGRGKSCFWAAHIVGCKVTGVEWVPLFIRLSRLLCKRANFIRGSMFEMDLSQASVVYYYYFDPRWPPFETMRPGARLITISEAFPSDAFAITHILDVEFPWGVTRGYIQIRKPDRLSEKK
jgi:hypothetical protein